jgi:hypothetical protein
MTATTGAFRSRDRGAFRRATSPTIARPPGTSSYVACRGSSPVRWSGSSGQAPPTGVVQACNRPGQVRLQAQAAAEEARFHPDATAWPAKSGPPRQLPFLRDRNRRSCRWSCRSHDQTTRSKTEQCLLANPARAQRDELHTNRNVRGLRPGSHRRTSLPSSPRRKVERSEIPGSCPGASSLSRWLT